MTTPRRPRRPWFNWAALPPRPSQEGWDWNRYFARHPHLMDFPPVWRPMPGQFTTPDPGRREEATP